MLVLRIERLDQSSCGDWKENFQSGAGLQLPVVKLAGRFGMPRALCYYLAVERNGWDTQPGGALKRLSDCMYKLYLVSVSSNFVYSIMINKSSMVGVL